MNHNPPHPARQYDPCMPHGLVCFARSPSAAVSEAHSCLTWHAQSGIGLHAAGPADKSPLAPHCLDTKTYSRNAALGSQPFYTSCRGLRLRVCCAAGQEGLCRRPLYQRGWALTEHVGNYHHSHCGHSSADDRLLDPVMLVLSSFDMLRLLLLSIVTRCVATAAADMLCRQFWYLHGVFCPSCTSSSAGLCLALATAAADILRTIEAQDSAWCLGLGCHAVALPYEYVKATR